MFFEIDENNINLNFTDHPEKIAPFIESFDAMDNKTCKELQKELIRYFSTDFFGSYELGKKYYQQATKYERIYENEYTFDARHILYVQGQYEGDHADLFSAIGVGEYKSYFGVYRGANKQSIGMLRLNKLGYEGLDTKIKKEIIDLFYERSTKGNHDRFHNISMETEHKFNKEILYGLEETIMNMTDNASYLNIMIKYPLLRKLHNMYMKRHNKKILSNISIERFDAQIKKEEKKHEDRFIRLQKFLQEIKEGDKRKKIDIPSIYGGGRAKRAGLFSGLYGTLYEYFSILVSFHTRNIASEHNPHILEEVKRSTKKFIDLIQQSDTPEEIKQYRIGNYMWFTSRIVDLEKLEIDTLEDITPIVYDQNGNANLFEYNKTLVNDSKRMHEGYTVT